MKSSGIRSSSLQVWLDKLAEEFKELPNEDKNHTLDYIIENCDSSQLFHLSEKLSVLLKRDFIAHLPLEVADNLLVYLDPDSLRNCCLVSKAWNSRINACPKAWQRACNSVGVKKSVTEILYDAGKCKKLYLATCARQKSLKMGRAFEFKRFSPHSNRVSAVCYKDGILATGSDDRSLHLLNCRTETYYNFPTDSVTDIKLMRDHAVTASFDSTASIWCIETGERVRHYQGHVSAILTVDFNEQLDIVVTGACDSNFKVWSLWRYKIPALLQSIAVSESMDWLVQANIYWNCKDRHYQLVTASNKSLYVWKLEKDSHNVLAKDKLINPHNNLITGFQLSGCKLTYAMMDPFNICHTVERSLEELTKVLHETSQEISRDLFVQTYIGGGDRYNAFLVIDGDEQMVHVVEKDSSEILVVIPFPLDLGFKNRPTSYCLGEKDWLNGFDGTNDQGLVFAASLKDQSVYFVQWKSLTHHKLSNQDNYKTELR